MDNGTRILIYNDISPTLDRGEIWLDSSIMPDVPISGVSIIGPTNGEKILTLCEVFIYGKKYFTSCMYNVQRKQSITRK